MTRSCCNCGIEKSPGIPPDLLPRGSNDSVTARQQIGKEPSQLRAGKVVAPEFSIFIVIDNPVGAKRREVLGYIGLRPLQQIPNVCHAPWSRRQSLDDGKANRMPKTPK